MRRVVVDATVLIGWFDGTEAPAARSLRAEYEAGAVMMIVPGVARGAMLDAARPRLTAAELAALASAMDRLGLEFRDPPITGLAAWVARGLRAEEAAGPALAASLDLPLISENPRVLRVAHALVREVR